MKKISLIAAVAASAIGLAACSDTAHHHTVPDVISTTRLSLVPQEAVTKNKPVTILAKLNGINSRALITNNDLTQPFQLIVADPTLTEFALVTPDKSNIPGVFSFVFTAKSTNGYRVWADVKPGVAVSKKMIEEFPQADLGAHRAGNILKTESHEASVDGYHFVLSFDKAPTEGYDATGTIRVTGSEGSTVKASGEIFGIYDDFHFLIRLPVDEASSFQLTPRKAGFIKFFAQIKVGAKTLIVPFGVNITKANQ